MMSGTRSSHSLMFTLPHLLALLQTYGYVLLFPIVMIEGPIATVLGGFLAAGGTLNIFILYPVVVAADVAGDLMYYLIGRFGGLPFAKRWGRYLGIDATRLSHIETQFQNRGMRVIIMGKITHAFGTVFIVAAGLARMPVWEFIVAVLLPTLPKSLLLVIIGYYFGQFYPQIDASIKSITLVLFVVIGAGLLLYFRPGPLRNLFKKRKNAQSS